MAKILKNTTISEVSIPDLGISIPASSSYTVQIPDYFLLADSSDTTSLVTSGDIVVNDGTNDLPSAQGLLYIRYPDDALRMHFLDDNLRSNGFTSKTVQEAIEEVRDFVAGKVVSWEFNSVGVTIDKWLRVGHPSIASNSVPFVSPWDGDIIGISFSNSVDSSDTDLEIYVNGTLEYTWDIRTKRTSYIADVSGLVSISQGDRISVFARDVGTTKPRDISGQLIAQLSAFTDGEGGTTTGV